MTMNTHCAAISWSYLKRTITMTNHTSILRLKRGWVRHHAWVINTRELSS